MSDSERIAALEQQVARLTRKLSKPQRPACKRCKGDGKQPGWHNLCGRCGGSGFEP